MTAQQTKTKETKSQTNLTTYFQLIFTMKKLTKKQILILLSIPVIGAFMIISKETQTPGEKRKEEITSQFSPVTGECYKLTELIKQSMKDPNSYENLNTKYWDLDTAILVNQEYTGKNQFGGRERGFLKATINQNGNISVIESR